MTATKSWRAWSSTVHVVVDDDRTLPDAAETLNDILDRVDRVFDRLSTRGMSDRGTIITTGRQIRARPVNGVACRSAK
jgi:hypothetical protein